MCGIAGFVDCESQTGTERLQAMAACMAEALTHRGPDHQGVWTDPRAGVALAHRRLSIMDLSPLGHQPMRSQCGQYVLVFNGEIYTFRSLRADLEQLGARFIGTSDTEVMLEAVSRFGVEQAITKCNGMFAFALWDTLRRVLVLGRDRFGEKPLYYGWAGKTFLFASELKALRRHPAFEHKEDLAAIASYLCSGYVPGPLSIYKGISKLTPGSLLTIDANQPGYTPEPHRYWSAREVYENGSHNPVRISENEAVEQLDHLLREAVKMRMQADVPLGAFLSGGIDSSTVVALMQSQASQPVKTFTIGFRDAPSETEHARAVAQHLGTEHFELLLSAEDALSVVPRLPLIYDEPFADHSQIPTYYVSEFARRQVVVSVSGDGGDEIFGGYSRYSWARASEHFKNVPAVIRKAAGCLLLLTPAALSSSLTQMAAKLMPGAVKPHNPMGALHRLGALLRSDNAVAAYAALASLDAEQIIRFPVHLGHEASLSRNSGLVRNMMYFDTVGYLPDDILVKLDRASMAVSLEARVPLLDHRVLEFAASLQVNTELAGSGKKQLLRRVLYRYVPSELVDRPKMGFGAPIRDWLRGPLRDWAEDLLDYRRLTQQGYLDAVRIRDQWSQHLQGKQNYENQLWSVLMLQAWLRAQSDLS